MSTVCTQVGEVAIAWSRLSLCFVAWAYTVLKHMHAVNTRGRAVYSVIANPDAAPQDEKTSQRLYTYAHNMQGSKDWENNAKATGARGLALGV